MVLTPFIWFNLVYEETNSSNENIHTFKVICIPAHCKGRGDLNENKIYPLTKILKNNYDKSEATFLLKLAFSLHTRPNIRPDFPLMSSKLSAFFFCGIRLLPVLKYKNSQCTNDVY